MAECPSSSPRSNIHFATSATYRDGRVPEDTEARPKLRETVRRCPICAVLPRLLYTMLDTQRGKTVRLYQCQCDKRICWDD